MADAFKQHSELIRQVHTLAASGGMDTYCSRRCGNYMCYYTRSWPMYAAWFVKLKYDIAIGLGLPSSGLWCKLACAMKYVDATCGYLSNHGPLLTPKPCCGVDHAAVTAMKDIAIWTDLLQPPVELFIPILSAAQPRYDRLLAGEDPALRTPPRKKGATQGATYDPGAVRFVHYIPPEAQPLFDRVVGDTPEWRAMLAAARETQPAASVTPPGPLPAANRAP